MPPLIPTHAAQRMLRDAVPAAAADYLFLEAWERAPTHGPALLRARQIRRANPAFAAELRAELRQGRPLTATERAGIGA